MSEISYIKISSDEENQEEEIDSKEENSTETSSTESSSSEETSEETSSSSDEFQQGPAKKPKVLKPKKALAKLARKKNDKKSKRSILEHVEKAKKVTSEVVGSDIEKELVRLEKKMAIWKKKKVEPQAMQRFVGRVMFSAKSLNIIVACDHAVFLKEMGLISLLELDLRGTLDESGPITPEVARMKSNRLLSLVIDSDARERIQQTWDGMAWMDRSLTQNSQGK